MGTAGINKVIEDFDHLPLDDKEYTLEVIKKQFIEAKRDRIAKRAKDAMANLKKGSFKRGSAADLLKDLDCD